MKRIKTEKVIEHPLETEFNIEAGTTVIETTVALPDNVIDLPDYDAKDNEIESKLEEIYSAAMNQVEISMDAMETVEGKYKGRVGEVTATMLTVALGAVKEKRELKIHKDKLMLERMNTKHKREDNTDGTTNITNNTMVVTADRNEIMALLRREKDISNEN